MQRWDIRLQGTTCQACRGRGWVEQQRDAHRSAGTVPCPAGYFRGHGLPCCDEGVLRFGDYDLANWCGQRGVRLRIKPRPRPRIDVSVLARRRGP